MALVSPSIATVSPFSLLDWRVYPNLYRIEHRSEGPQPIEPKMVEVLAVLAQHAGTPVTRQTLLDTVWADVVVSDDVLTRCISELRKLLGDDARRPTVIETLPRVGYRLITPVTWLPVSSPASALPPEAEPSVVRPAMRAWLWPVGLLVLGVVLWSAAWPTSPEAPAEPLVFQPLTTAPSQEREARVSPNGERVVYVADQGTGFDLFVRRFAIDAAPLQLTQDRATESSPTWSPDGQQIAFVRTTSTTCGVFTVPALGGPATRRADCSGSRMLDLDWSTDGTWLVTSVRTPENQYRLARIDLSEAVSPITALPYSHTTHGDYMPRFSPSGTHLSFIGSVGEGQNDLFALALTSPADSLPLTRLTTNRFATESHAWSATGDALYSITRQNGFGQLVRVSWPELHVAPISTEQLGTELTIGADRLVTTEYERVVTMQAHAPSGATPLFASTATDAFPSYAPNRSSLAFLSTRGGTLQLWLGDLDRDHPQLLTTNQELAYVPPRWSPDGQRLAYVAFDDGYAEVYIIDDVTDPQPRRLTDSPSSDVYPMFSADGAWLYFGSDREGAMDLWRQPVGGGPAVRVTEDGGMISQLSSDGRWLYYQREGQPGVWQQPTDGTQPTILFAPSIDLSMLGRWWPHADGLIALAQTGTRDTAALVAIQSTGTDTLRTFSAQARLGAAYHPDYPLITTRLDRQHADLLWTTLR
ncbi:MAG: winged helix-turn-helix domain-containing protein [Rhodothermales bacterium]